jgi:hypothetical protein
MFIRDGAQWTVQEKQDLCTEWEVALTRVGQEFAFRACPKIGGLSGLTQDNIGRICNQKSTSGQNNGSTVHVSNSDTFNP